MLDLTGVPDLQDYSVLPKGEYPVQLEKAEIKETKDGSGSYINAQFTVIGEKYEGRKLFAIFNIKNNSEKAQKIGLQQLKSLVAASGDERLLKLNTPGDLEGVKVLAKVEVQNDSYGEKNVIKGYKALTLANNNQAMKTATNVFGI